MRRGLIVAVLVSSVIAACTGGPSESTGTSSSADPPTTTDAPASGGAPTTAETNDRDPLLDGSGDPVLWFEPLPPLTDPSLPFGDGSVDYLDLFAEGAPWQDTAARVDVFGIPSTWVRHYSSDEEVRTLIDGLAALDIPLALSVGALPAPTTGEGCLGAEGYEGVYALDMMRRIMDLGGTIEVIGFDEPYAFGHKADGPTDCQRSLDVVAAQAAAFTRAARELLPDVVIGVTEPLWAAPAIGADDMGAWLDAYEEAAGEPFAFLHIDVDWHRPGWAKIAREVEQVADSRGVPFGLIYFGGPDGTSDETWIEAAVGHIDEFERVAGGSPDHIVFASWEDFPTHVLPDTDPNTFTGLIRRYFATSSTMTVEQVPASGGTLSLAGSLESIGDGGGKPIAGAAVAVEATPHDGQPQGQAATGIVPEGAVRGVVVVRINAEGAGPGAADIRLYGVDYTEGAGSSLIPDPAFTGGGWTPYGSGSGTFVASDRGDGKMLQLTAAPDQDLLVDSRVFRVTAGAPFEFTVTDSVPDQSAGHGFIAMVFLGSDDIEISRSIIEFRPVPQPLGEATTDASGAVEGTFQVASGHWTVTATYAGDLDHRGAGATFEADVS